MKNTALLFALFLFTSFLQAQNPDIFVTSRNTNSVKRYNGNDGTYLGDFVDANSGGLIQPQEVLFHSSGDLLVTGIFNAAIKRYDGQTGDYLGDFTSGYNLNMPTKTMVGPDGYLYVSQWSDTQNKVIRFNFETGVFIDEFTSIGVPTGNGQAWDQEGNLYVSRFGNGANGNVYKFDSLGNFQEIFINSDILQGPTNLWFGDPNHLWVADWSVGEVLRFNIETGDYVDKVITGMQTVEGFVYDAAGFLYLCDWNGNAVYKVDTISYDLQLFTNSGGLASPNSITFRPQSTPAPTLLKDDFQINLFPNPTGSSTNMTFTLEKESDVFIRILNTSGQAVKIINSGKLQAGTHNKELNLEGFESGLYFYEIEVNGAKKSGQLVLTGH